MGGITQVADDSDLPPDDGNQCRGEICSGGTPSHPLQPQGTACNQNGGTLCDGMGNCVQCLMAADCPPTGNQCVLPTCSPMHQCGTTNAPTGALCNQSGGTHCNGMGSCVP